MADSLRETFRVAHQGSMVQGVHDRFPADLSPEFGSRELRNLEVFDTGVARPRGSLKTRQTFSSKNPVALFTHKEFLVVVLVDGVRFWDGRGDPIEVSSDTPYSRAVRGVTLLDRFYLLEPGTVPRYWQPGFSSMKVEEGGLGDRKFPEARDAVFFQGRAWAAEGDLLYFSLAPGIDTETEPISKTRQFEWDRANFAFRSQTGDIRRIVPLRNFALVVFTDRGVETIEPDQCNIVESTQLVNSTEIGLGEASDSVLLVGEDVLFVDQDGQVRSLAKSETDETQGVTDQPLSESIRNVTDRQQKDRLVAVRAAFYDGEYHVAWPTGSARSADELWKWSPSDKAWSGPYRFAEDQVNDSVIPVQIAGMTPFSIVDERRKLWALVRDGADAKLCEMESTDQQDLGSDEVPARLVTRAFTMDRPDAKKGWQAVEVEAVVEDADTDLTMTVEVSVNGGSWQSAGTLTFGATVAGDGGTNHPTLDQTLNFKLGEYVRQRQSVQIGALVDRTEYLQVRLTVASKAVEYQIVAVTVTGLVDNVDL